MNIFGGLFNKFFSNSRNRNSHVNASDRTPAKVQIMRHSLVGIRVSLDDIPINYSNYKYRLLVPKRLYAPYKEAMKRAEKNKNFLLWIRLVLMDILILYIIMLNILIKEFIK